MTAPLKLATSLVLSLLMWLPTIPGALTAHEDPARIAGRYLLALLIARIGVGVVFRVIAAYAVPEAVEEPEEEVEEAPVADDSSPYVRRRDDLIEPEAASDQELFDEALDEVEDTAAMVP